MNILGISAYYHDSTTALVCDGQIVAAAQEERFTRIKHDQQFPVNAVEYCLEQACMSAEQLAISFLMSLFKVRAIAGNPNKLSTKKYEIV